MVRLAYVRPAMRTVPPGRIVLRALLAALLVAAVPVATAGNASAARSKGEPSMPYLVRAFPLIRPVAELHGFVAALSGTRRAETDAFYRQYGVSHESVYLQETEHGPLVIVVTNIEDRHQASPRFMKASESFEVWFKAQLLHLTGVDPNVSPLGPPTTEIFTWPPAAAR
jgi:hypothetical protein